MQDAEMHILSDTPGPTEVVGNEWKVCVSVFLFLCVNTQSL